MPAGIPDAARPVISPSAVTSVSVSGSRAYVSVRTSRKPRAGRKWERGPGLGLGEDATSAVVTGGGHDLVEEPCADPAASLGGMDVGCRLGLVFLAGTGEQTQER